MQNAKSILATLNSGLQEIPGFS